MKHLFSILVVTAFLMTSVNGFSGDFTKYHTPDELTLLFKKLSADHSDATHNTLAKSPGGKEVIVLEIGEDDSMSLKPAVFLVANLEGNVPLASEAALFLAEKLLQDSSLYSHYKWFIVPVGNPDAAGAFFQTPQFETSGNMTPYNDDMDDQIDEDGPEDLNGDGLITSMRVKDPEGQYIPEEKDSRIMRRADGSKGEKGIYKIFTEGYDNDKDGKFNEDGPGGTNINRNFPHLFKSFEAGNGLWPGSEAESYGIMEYIFRHPEIAMTLSLGDTNFCFQAPKGGRKGQADFSKVKIPKRMGRWLGVDTSKTYTMEEVMEMAEKVAPPGVELTESMVASFLGLGAVVNPLTDDLKYYEMFNDEYKEFLKDQGIPEKMLDPERAEDGSFELWSYYHLGIPTFSMDFWRVPEPEEKKESKADSLKVDKLSDMTNEEFIALGEDRINKFLEENGSPSGMKAERLIKMLESGVVDTKKMAKMMERMGKKEKKKDGELSRKDKALLTYSDSIKDNPGFVNWQKVSHPDLGDVEVGGYAPYLETCPPEKDIQNLLEKQIPWVFKLVEKLPNINIEKINVTQTGEDIFKIKAYIGNQSVMSYPTAMGERNGRITPLIVSLEGDCKILSGKKRDTVKMLKGYEIRSIEWLVKCSSGTHLNVKVTPMNALIQISEITVGGDR